jgi:CubicO group peptidase (beta-lactamase class C family)
MNVKAALQAFHENFSSRGEIGAGAAVWDGDGEIVCLSGGFQDRERSKPWEPDTPALVWSATKGPASACLLHALDSAGIPLDSPVAAVWPAFAANGKAAVNFRMLLHHQSGLCALDSQPPVEDFDAVRQALERQHPAWEPGSAHGYHPRTFGFLLDGAIQHITGSERLGAYWRRVFGGPLQLDFWIGAPEDLLPRIAPVLPPQGTMSKGDPFLAAFMTPGSLTSRSFASPKGLHSAASMNTREARTASYPGFGGIGTAAALAKFYAMLACGGTWRGTVFLQPETLGALRKTQVQGPDRVLLMETAFSHGFMRDPVAADGTKLRETFGPSPGAFGHPGAGGSLAFADPDRGIGFAYIMNQMEPGVLPNLRAISIVKALYSH